MVEDQAREDIAFIRRTIEEGSTYATGRSPDMLVWGVAVTVGYLGTYGFVRGWSPITPQAVWAVCLGLPWLRWIAIAWWLGELALFALRHHAEALLLSAALMLVLLAGPGYLLLQQRGGRAMA